VPAADDEAGRDREQDDEGDVEAVLREPRLLTPYRPSLPLRAVVSVAELDGRWIDRRLVGR